MPLNDTVRAHLRAATRQRGHDLSVTFPPLGDDYDAVNAALKGLGAAWQRPRRAHVFTGSCVEAEARLDHAITTGRLPDLNPLSFYPTPDSVAQAVAARAIERARVACRAEPIRVLDPSAGTGSLLAAVQQLVPVYDEDAFLDLQAVELDEGRRAVLAARGFRVIGHDALDPSLPGEQDIIVMNPPFSVPGAKQAWAAHLRAAIDLLTPGGVLSAVVPGQDARTFLTSTIGQFVARHDFYAERLPAGSFRATGTAVDTMLVTVSRRPAVREPHEGFSSYGAWNAMITVQNCTNLRGHLEAILTRPANTDARWSMAWALRQFYDGVVYAQQTEGDMHYVLTDADHASLHAHHTR